MFYLGGKESECSWALHSDRCCRYVRSLRCGRWRTARTSDRGGGNVSAHRAAPVFLRNPKSPHETVLRGLGGTTRQLRGPPPPGSPTRPALCAWSPPSAAHRLSSLELLCRFPGPLSGSSAAAEPCRHCSEGVGPAGDLGFGASRPEPPRAPAQQSHWAPASLLRVSAVVGVVAGPHT